MAEKRDSMIGAGRFTTAQIHKATGASEASIEKRRYRLRKKFGKAGQFIVQSPSTLKEGSGPGSPPSPEDVPTTPAGVRAELQRMLKRQKEMEQALKNDGPQAMPAILAILSQQRSTIETILKAEVIFANMPDLGARETPGQRMAETQAYFSKLIEGAPPEVRAWILRAMTEPAPAGAPELRHCETETPGFSKTGPENNGDCRIPEAG